QPRRPPTIGDLRPRGPVSVIQIPVQDAHHGDALTDEITSPILRVDIRVSHDDGPADCLDGLTVPERLGVLGDARSPSGRSDDPERAILEPFTSAGCGTG